MLQNWQLTFAPLLLLLTPGFHRSQRMWILMFCGGPALSCRRPNISNIFLVIHYQDHPPPIPQRGNKPSPSIGVGIFQALLEICVYTDMEFYLLIKLLNPHPTVYIEQAFICNKVTPLGNKSDSLLHFCKCMKSCEEAQLWISSVVQKNETVFLLSWWSFAEWLGSHNNVYFIYHLFVIHCWQINTDK